MSEITIVATMVLIAMIFFSLAYFFILSKSSEVQRAEIESEGKNIVEMILKVSKDPSSHLQYFTYLPLSNLSIEKGLLEYERQGYKYAAFFNANVSDVKLENIASVCIVKKDSTISLLDKCPSCNDNSICEPDECSSDCPDCYGPAQACINDGYCNIAIKENCENSNDCKCNTNEICCPQDPNADKLGCLQKSKGKEGEECYCDAECENGLKCNPTASNFKQYSKACCPPGKSWNGSACIASYCSYPCVDDCIPPEKWDWRNVNGINYLNPVRHQESCGACWAFSAIGAIEGVYNVEANCPACNKDLSEQQLISNNPPCCGSCGSCNGGWPHLAFSYIKNRGVVDEKCCPYFSNSYGLNPVANCPICSDYSSRAWTITNYGWISNNFEDIKRAVICHGPLSVASMNWGHAIVLVGYDDNRGVWIIRNSWGPWWGDGGYGYIPYSGHPYSDLKDYVYYVEGVKAP